MGWALIQEWPCGTTHIRSAGNYLALVRDLKIGRTYVADVPEEAAKQLQRVKDYQGYTFAKREQDLLKMEILSAYWNK